MNAGLLEHIRTFLRAVETGSFTAVAAEQQQSQPTVSRQISALEEHLGVRLLQRTTRALTLTEEGRTYYQHACAMLGVSNAEGRHGFDKDPQEATRWYREMQTCDCRDSSEMTREKAAAWLHEHP